MYELKDEELDEVNGGEAISAPYSEIDDFIPQKYSVILKNTGPNRFPAIKIICNLRDCSINQAMTLIDSLPFTVLEAVSLERAQQVYNQFSNIGATCEIV